MKIVILKYAKQIDAFKNKFFRVICNRACMPNMKKIRENIYRSLGKSTLEKLIGRIECINGKKNKSVKISPMQPITPKVSFNFNSYSF